MTKRCTITWLFLATLACPAIADTLVVNTIPYRDVRVTAVRDGEVFYIVRGNEVRKPISQVTKITLDDEPAFNSAEEAFGQRDWDKATEGYEKTLRTTQKPWLRDWVAVRLLESANQAGRFDAAVKAYIALAEKSPESARAIQLNLPKPDSAYITEAITLVNAAVSKSKQNGTKDVLLNLLIDLHRAKGDMKAANDALTRRMELAASDPNSPEAARAAATLKLKAITIALASKEYDKVIDLVEKDNGILTDSADQAEALLALADAKAAKTADSKDPQAWKEVALSYMRVVAHAPSTSPQIPAALLKTAAIHAQRLSEKDTAIRIYEQIKSDYKGQPPAQQAESELGKLK